MKSLDHKKLLDNHLQILTENCLPFWVRYGVDREYGGLLTCLDRTGGVYNWDKSVWFQGRGLWMFSKACNELGNREEWMDAAKSAYDFVSRYGFDKDGRMFFIVTRDGRPVQKRRYFYSETFAAIGMAEYSKASGDMEALERSRQIYRMAAGLYEDPSKTVPKYIPETVKMKSMAPPMIMLATSQCLREIDEENRAYYDGMISRYLGELLGDFAKEEYRAMFENVGEHGEKIDSPKGRLVNPGHAIEASWFIMSEGILRNDSEIIKKALDILDWSMEWGWDEKYGGLCYFIDIDGRPAEQLEWDMKLWWPHTEAVYALLLAYLTTKDEKYSKKFDMVYDYAFNNFPDREHSEWFGYLHRDGSVSNTLKGSLFKGPFHLPRMLLLTAVLLKKHMQGADG